MKDADLAVQAFARSRSVADLDSAKARIGAVSFQDVLKIPEQPDSAIAGVWLRFFLVLDSAVEDAFKGGLRGRSAGSPRINGVTSWHCVSMHYKPPI
jgi:hypothetical protein